MFDRRSRLRGPPQHRNADDSCGETDSLRKWIYDSTPNSISTLFLTNMCVCTLTRKCFQCNYIYRRIRSVSHAQPHRISRNSFFLRLFSYTVAIKNVAPSCAANEWWEQHTYTFWLRWRSARGKQTERTGWTELCTPFEGLNRNTEPRSRSRCCGSTTNINCSWFAHTDRRRRRRQNEFHTCGVLAKAAER